MTGAPESGAIAGAAMNMALQTSFERITKNGPTRVIIDDDGAAIGAKRAQQLGVVPDVVFIRDDGWSLGATEQHESIAHLLWLDKWIGFFRRGSDRALPIEQYEAS